MVCRKLVSLAVKRWCEEQKYCSKKLSALCQHTAPETVPRLTWNYQEAGKFLEGQKRRICEAVSIFQQLHPEVTSCHSDFPSKPSYFI